MPIGSKWYKFVKARGILKVNKLWENVHVWKGLVTAYKIDMF